MKVSAFIRGGLSVRRLAISAFIGFFISIGAAQLDFASDAPATQPVSPFDVLVKSYSPFTDMTDPLGFALKVERLTSSPYRFWRGAKDLFFLEAKDDDRDWLADRSTFHPSHGDIHASNIGTYASDGKLGDVAFGLVDFDDSAPLPPQIDVLEALVSLNMAMDESSTHFSQADHHDAVVAMLNGYSRALASDETAASMLADDRVVQKLIGHAKRATYDSELSKYVKDDAFVAMTMSKQGELHDVLRRQPRETFNDFAGALAAGIAASERPERFRYHTPDEWRHAVVDVAQRISLSSAGSQGLSKYFILVDHPLVDSSSQYILYLKQQIPSAAARQNVAPSEPSPGDRCRDCAAALTQPHPWLNASATLPDGRSFALSLKEPWSDNLTDATMESREDALAFAKRCGIAIGVAHRYAGHPREWLGASDSPVRADLELRATRCVKRVNDDYRAFLADPRVAPLRKEAKAAIAAIR